MEFDLMMEMGKLIDRELEKVSGGKELMELDKAIEEFVRECPMFERENELGHRLGIAMANLKTALLRKKER